MTWGKRKKEQRDWASTGQAQADAALVKSLDDAERVSEVTQMVDEKVSLLRRVNRENNFSVRMEMAYRGEA
jgi:hypothetical protein